MFVEIKSFFCEASKTKVCVDFTGFQGKYPKVSAILIVPYHGGGRRK
jgi:hypothetical protein